MLRFRYWLSARLIRWGIDALPHGETKDMMVSILGIMATVALGGDEMSVRFVPEDEHHSESLH